MKFSKFINPFLLLLLLFCVMQSCKEDIDTSDRYTYSKKSITAYLESHEQFSEYCAMLGQVKISRRSQSTVKQLLSARGNYTVFAPSNEAIYAYLDSLTKRGIISAPSWDAFDSRQLDSIRQVIVFNSIIDGGDYDYAGNSILYETNSFPSAANEYLETPTMSDRKLTVRHGVEQVDSIWINDNALMSMYNRDVSLLNGVLHQMESVIAPGNEALTALLQSFLDENQEGFMVAAKMVLACGLNDTLGKIRDEVYEELYETGILQNLDRHPTEGSVGTIPEHRKYGFTLFAETDDFWRRAIGKSPADITIEDVKQYLIGQGVYPDATTDNNYTSPSNLIYQFITYHLLPVCIPVDKLVIHYNERGYDPKTQTLGVPMYELYTSMGQRRLIKIYESKQCKGVYLNRFPKLNNGRAFL